MAIDPPERPASGAYAADRKHWLAIGEKALLGLLAAGFFYLVGWHTAVNSTLQDHETRLKYLEKSDDRNSVKFDKIMERLNSLPSGGRPSTSP